MMNPTLPGTTLPLASLPDGKQPFDALTPVFAVSGGGLLLSQVCELSGLAPSTVQNWVKRGWIPATRNKRYAPRQVARILIYSLLRSAMRLEQIAALLTVINGVVDDPSDDLIEETALYNVLCGAVIQMQSLPAVSPDGVKQLAAEALAAHGGIADIDRRERLAAPLTVMLYSIAAADWMSRAEQLYDEIIE